MWRITENLIINYMGMFDEIKVGKTYLKDLLTKEQEAIIKQGDDVYQTKDLKNVLGSYKIYKRKLWEDTTSRILDNRDYVGKVKDEEPPKPKWEEVKITQEISFCNLILVDGDEHWFEFRFLFKDGKIDRKHLDDYTTRTEEELEKEEEEWAIIRSYYDAHKSRLTIKIYEWIGKKFLAISTYFSRKSSIPEEIRKTAYKAAGKEYGRGSW